MLYALASGDVAEPIRERFIERAERRDHIIAGLVERVNALPAGQDAAVDAIPVPPRDDLAART